MVIKDTNQINGKEKYALVLRSKRSIVNEKMYEEAQSNKRPPIRGDLSLKLKELEVEAEIPRKGDLLKFTIPVLKRDNHYIGITELYHRGYSKFKILCTFKVTSVERKFLHRGSSFEENFKIVYAKEIKGNKWHPFVAIYLGEFFDKKEIKNEI